MLHIKNNRKNIYTIDLKEFFVVIMEVNIVVVSKLKIQFWTLNSKWRLVQSLKFNLQQQCSSPYLSTTAGITKIDRDIFLMKIKFIPNYAIYGKTMENLRWQN